QRAPLRLVWQDSYNSGNETIDAQHRALFDLANAALGQAVEGYAGSGGKLAGTVKTLYGTLEGHFADEEAVLAAFGFPEAELEAHRREHGSLLVLAGRLAEHIACQPDTTVSALLDFVNEVVFRHLLNEDSRFFALTRARGAIPSRGGASGT
ncbi:MAG: hemerythrin domain-containing protein, partial [Spirochaetaceae bacterium]|nr:hemerythrin domain-containing protein [Spirochaetaceae bacterium]